HRAAELGRRIRASRPANPDEGRGRNEHAKGRAVEVHLTVGEIERYRFRRIERTDCHDRLTLRQAANHSSATPPNIRHALFGQDGGNKPSARVSSSMVVGPRKRSCQIAGFHVRGTTFPRPFTLPIDSKERGANRERASTIERSRLSPAGARTDRA